MNFEDLIWVNIDIHKYKDIYYGSDSTLDLSYSCFTSDEINFSPIKFRLTTISNNNIRKICSLNPAQTVDLYKTFKKIQPNFQQIYDNPQQGDITRRINDQDLIFEFRRHSSTGEPLVNIKISNGNSDFGHCIIPLNPEFCFLAIILDNFKSDYLKIQLQLQQKYYQQKLYFEQKQILNSIKTLPSQLTLIPDLPSNSSIKNNEVIDDTTSKEFEDFVEKEEDNVVIPELESMTTDSNKSKVQDIKSIFIDDVLKCDISVFENIINSLYATNNPLMSFIEILQKHISVDHTPLPGISDNELKSSVYLSTFMLKSYIKGYLEKKTPIPTTIQIIKYSPPSEQVTQENIDLAYDLLLISLYLKLFRSKIESVNSDIQENKAVFHMVSRLITDILSISFISNQKPEVVQNFITTRFKYYNENTKFFEDLNIILDRNGCTRIYENEMAEICKALFKSALINQKNIKYLHNDAYGAGLVVLQPENDLSLEQITNELIPIELKVKFGGDVNSLTQNEDIKKLFTLKSNGKVKNSNNSKKINSDQRSHILRHVELHMGKVPEKYQDTLINHLKNINNENVDLNIVPLEELGDDVVKGLYTWNQLIDKNVGYTKFSTEVEESISKDLIISKVKSEITEEDNQEDWGNLMDLMQ